MIEPQNQLETPLVTKGSSTQLELVFKTKVQLVKDVHNFYEKNMIPQHLRADCGLDKNDELEPDLSLDALGMTDGDSKKEE